MVFLQAHSLLLLLLQLTQRQASAASGEGEREPEKPTEDTEDKNNISQFLNYKHIIA